MSPLPKHIIDCHIHFWHPDKVYIPWVKGTEFDQRRDAIEYAQQTKLAHVQTAVYVETDVDPYHCLVEAEWIAHYADSLKATELFGGIGGIVAFAPIFQGKNVRNYLETLTKIMTVDGRKSKLKGVRYLIQDPNLDPKRILDPEFICGIQCLELFDLSFDININCNRSYEQFPPLQKMVAQCPRVQFILDHMGKPPCDSRPGEPLFEYWKHNITELAVYPNVACKISGLLTELKGNGHYKTQTEIVQQLKPFVQHVRKVFGSDRILFGGDWPICESSGLKWQNWLEILVDIVQDWSEVDKEKLFVINSTQFYKLSS